MKRFAVVVAAMIVALMATGALAQGTNTRPRQRQVKNLFVFTGTVKDISRNKVTIDIEEVRQPGKGKIDFSQNQWTFTFGSGASIFKNNSPARLRDFGSGDRVVIEAQKRSARNYVPTRMSDEASARGTTDRMGNRQGDGRNLPQGVFVFNGTVRNISGNKVTIDINEVHQPGKGKIDFSQSQWTFTFGTGAKILKNNSPARLRDFRSGDRVVIEAQKRSERNYEPTRMSDEASARRK